DLVDFVEIFLATCRAASRTASDRLVSPYSAAIRSRSASVSSPSRNWRGWVVPGDGFFFFLVVFMRSSYSWHCSYSIGDRNVGSAKKRGGRIAPNRPVECRPVPMRV